MEKLGKAFRKTLPNSFQSAIKKATNKGKEKVGEITKNAENSQTSAEDGATDGQYLAATFEKNYGIKKAKNSVEIQNAQPSTAEEPAKDAKNAENSQSPAENGATADGQSLATFENNENLKNEICSICLDEDNLLSTDPKNSEVKELNKCHHRFHRECVDGWLITNQTCPTCRGVEADSNDLPATAAAAGSKPVANVEPKHRHLTMMVVVCERAAKGHGWWALNHVTMVKLQPCPYPWFQT
ncbi:hypothetical protein niasHT_012182 [Heterodera trifolii]|uniref:RING-type domain-containing protein n=1 Tax=Heterodera trifolii TaxID=157864 RepID=A0ABD2KU62_9BILA